MNNDNLKGLYETLKREGYEPPVYEQFEKDMQDEKNLQGAYQTLKNEGYEPPAYETFRSDMGFRGDGSDGSNGDNGVNGKDGSTVTQQPTQPVMGQKGQTVIGGKEQPQYSQEVYDRYDNQEVTRKGVNDIELKLLEDIAAEMEAEKAGSSKAGNGLISRALGAFGQHDAQNAGMGLGVEAAAEPLPAVKQQDTQQSLEDPLEKRYAQIVQEGNVQESPFQQMVVELLGSGKATTPVEAQQMAYDLNYRYADKTGSSTVGKLLDTIGQPTSEMGTQIDNGWYNEGVQSEIEANAKRLGLNYDDYVRNHVKPAMQRELEQRYGYSEHDAKVLSGRMFENPEHVRKQMEYNAAGNIIGNFMDGAVRKEFSDLDRQASPLRDALDMSGESFLYAKREYNKQTDPDKILSSLLDKQHSLYIDLLTDSKSLNQIQARADALGIGLGDYLDQYVAPQLNNAIVEKFRQVGIERELPKDTMDYVLGGFEDSVGGMLLSRMMNGATRQEFKNEALAMTEAGENPYMDGKPGLLAQGGRLATGMAADFWLWGGWGKIGSKATQQLMKERIAHLAAERGVTEAVAYRLAEEEAGHYLKKGVVNNLFKHVPQSAITMSGAEATTAAVQGIRDRQDIGTIINNTVGQGVHGAFTGTAFGLTGGLMGGLTQGLTGAKRLLGKLAGLEVEAATLYTTEELARMANGEEAFDNPFEGLVESNVKLGFIKASANPVRAIGRLFDAVRHPVKALRAATESQHTLTDEDVADIMSSNDGRTLMDALTAMRPADNAREPGNRLGEVSVEDAEKSAAAYRDFMTDPERPWIRKQKVARLLGGMLPPPGLEVSAEQVKNGDGTWSVRTRDYDGQTIRLDKYDCLYDTYVAIDDMERDLDTNRTEALRQRIDMYDAYRNYSGYLEAEYETAVQKMRSGAELTDGEKQVVYLHQHRGEMLDIQNKLNDGEELSEEENRLGHIYTERFNDYVRRGSASDAFTREWEKANGLPEGTVEQAIYSPERDETQQRIADAYREAMEERIEELKTTRQERDDERTIEPIGAIEAAAQPQPAENGGDGASPSYERGRAAIVNGDGGEMRRIGHEVNVADARIARMFSKEEAAAIYQAVESGDKGDLVAIQSQYTESAKRDAIMKLAEALDAARGMDAAFDEQTAGIEGEVRAEAERYQSEDGRIVPLTLSDGSTAFLMNGDPENEYGTVNVAYTDEGGQVQHKQIAARDITSIGEAEATDAYVARRTEELRKEQEGNFENQIGGVDLRTGNTVELTMDGQTAPFRIDGFFDNGDLQLSDEGGEAMRRSRDEVIGMIRATEEKRVGEELDAEEKALKEAEKARKEAEKAEAERLKGVERDRRAQIEEIRNKVLKDSKDFKDGDMEVMGEMGVMGDLGEMEKYLLEHFDSEVDADAFIREQRVALRNYQRDEVQPKIDALQRDLDSYARSEREMTPEELAAVIQQHTQLMRQQEFLNSQAQKLKDASKRVGKMYSGKVGTQGLDATDSRSRRLLTLQKARSYEDKLKKARELYAGDAEASSLFDFESMEPKTIEEYAAEFLGAVPEQGKGIIDFESLQEETGHGGRRVGGDSRGYSAYLAPKGKGESIKALAHKMWERLPEQLHENWTDQDCRNALIEVLSSAQVPTDIRDYILNDRINQAEKYLRAQEEYEEELRMQDWAEAYHIPAGEREAYEESIHQIGEEYSSLTDDDIQKINAIFAEKYESRDEQDRRSQEMDRQPVAAGDGGDGTGGQGEIRPLSSETADTQDQGRPDGDGQDVGKDKDAATAPVVSDSDVAGGAQGGGRGDYSRQGDLAQARVSVPLSDGQGNPIDAAGKLIIEKVDRIDDITDEDFSNPTRSIELPKIPQNVDNAIGGDGKPVVIKKNILEKNSRDHSDLTPEQSREILFSALYNPSLYGQNRKTTKPHNWVVISTKNTEGKNRLVLLEVNNTKDNVEIVHWHYVRDTALETIKRQAEREGGQILILPSEEEAGGLSSRTLGSSFVGKDTENISNLQENGEKVAAKQQPAEKSSSIQGIEGYDADEVLNAVRGDIEMKLEDAGIDGVTIKGMALHGSRMRGDARKDSDLDVVVEYEGDFSEDALFNVLNEVPTTIEGIKVDINPITKGKSGTLEEYMKRSREYDEEKTPSRPPRGEEDKDLKGFKERLATAVEETNTEPTEGQKEAGNYKKGHLSFGGYNFTVENPKGSVRSGKDASGKPWSITMHNTYGYLTGKGHLGKDGDHLDVFINDDADLDLFGNNGNKGSDEKIYIIDQVNADGSFDEHKIMWGFNSEVDAIRNYLMNYSRPWHGLGNITGVDKATFDKWVESSDRKVKPFAETRFGDKRDVAAKVMDVVATKSQHTVKKIVKRWKDGELQEMEDGHISTLMRRLEGQKAMNNSLLERYKGKKREQLERNNAQIDADLEQLRGEQDRRASLGDAAGEPTQGYGGVVSLKPEMGRAGRWVEGDLFAAAKPQPTEKDLFGTEERRNSMAKIVSMRPVEPRLDNWGLTGDYPYLQSFKKDNPDALAAQDDGKGGMVFRGIDAVAVENITGLKGGTVKGVRELTIPSANVDRYLPMLVKRGKRIAVIDPENPPVKNDGGRAPSVSIKGDAGNDSLRQLLESKKNRDADYLRQLIRQKESYISQLKQGIPEEERLYEEWQRAVGTKNEEKAQRAYEKYYAEHEEMILAWDEARNELEDLYWELGGKLSTAIEKKQKQLEGMSDKDLLDAIGKEDSTDRYIENVDRQDCIEEYDLRHKEEYDAEVESYMKMLDESGTELDEAYGMYSSASGQWAAGGYHSDERTKLRAQIDVLEDYIERKEDERYEREMEEEEREEEGAAAAQPQPTEKEEQYEADKEAVRTHGYDLTGLKMRDLDEGETSQVERRYVENGFFSFTSGERVESAGDVAFMFRALEDAAVENSFMVLIKDGEPTVVHLAIGNYNGVMAPIEQAFVAAQAIDPDSVVFVHNHPSGVLNASREDKTLQEKIEIIFGSKARPGIIIDTKSGKYAEFSGNIATTSDRPQTVDKEVPVKVFSFSKQVFDKDWDPEEALKVDSSNNIAAFVSSHRLGEHPKMSLIVLNNQMRVTGNIFLPWTKLEDACSRESLLRIATCVNQMGGNQAVVYGDFLVGENSGRLLRGLSTNLKGFNIRLLDVMNFENKSAFESGVITMEPEMEYKGSAKEMMEAVGKRYHGKEMVFLNKTHGEEQILKDLGLYDEAAGLKGTPKYEAIMKDFRKNLEKTVASYNRDTKKIYIFAPDMTSSKAEEVFFHENIHAILDDWYGGGKRGIADRFWDVMPDDGKVSKTYVKEKSSDESEYAEEAFAYWLSRSMKDGDVSDFLNYFDDADKKRINNILKTLDYDTEEESGRRVRLRRNQHVSEAQSGYSETHQGTGGKASGGAEEGLTDAASEPLPAENTEFSIRQEAAPRKTGIGYKVFVLKDGKLYPPMVANPGGEDTPVGVWLNADAAPVSGTSKTGRPQVKAGGKGTQGGSGQLAYRPGWHLGVIPYALQFGRKDPVTGERTLFPNNFVWAEVEYANDVDYQEEARQEGINANGKYQHSLAGLKHLPVDGSYMYRTNPDPNTDPWIITGAMRVKRVLKPSEVDELVKAAGREPQKRQEGFVTDEQVDNLNKAITLQRDKEREAHELATKAVMQILGKSGVKYHEVSQDEAQDVLKNAQLLHDGRSFHVDTPVFVSNALKAVEGIKQEKATPEQWLKMIEKNGGLKAGEDKWMGLSEWLNQRKTAGHGGSITKQEVLDFIRANQIQVEEVNYNEHIDLDNNSNMKQFREEFDDFVEKFKNEKEAVDAEMVGFNDEMYGKYGEGWAGKLSSADKERGEELQSRYNRLTDGDPKELAFNEMVEKYGDDFGMAFEINYGNGKLDAQMDMYGDDISDAAKHFLEFEEQPINSTRLSYTTSGLENKKEIALTVPTVESWNEDDEIHFGDAGGGRAVAWVRFGETEGVPNSVDADRYHDYSRKMKEAISRRNEMVEQLKRYKGGMLTETQKRLEEEETYIQQLRERYKDVADVKPTRVLVIDEIQSKRHQEGREKGYRKELPPYTEDMLSVVENDGFWEIGEDLGGGNVRNLNYYSTEMMSREEAVSEYIKTHERVKPGIPDAPFDKNWHELAMKRMLRYAAENGYDKVAWTKGEQQAERYSLSKAFDSVEREDNPSVNGRRFVFSGRNVENFVVDDEGKVIDSTINDSKGKNLSELVGKDMAVKLMALENGDIIEDGLRIGGEGMKGFYDQMLPRFMDKYGKKWGVKTGEVKLPNVQAEGNPSGTVATMWAVDVTPEMRESVMQGQPMFSAGGKEPLVTSEGVVYGYTDGKDIYLTPEGINPETPAHEYGHLWVKAVKKNRPDLWENIKDLMRVDEHSQKVYRKLLGDENYSQIHDNEDKLYEEVLTQMGGRKNRERFEQAAREVIDEAPTAAEAVKVASVISRIRRAFRKLWDWVGKSLFQIKKFRSVDEVTDRMMYDFVRERNNGERDDVISGLRDNERGRAADSQQHTQPDFQVGKGKPRKMKGEGMAHYFERLREWDQREKAKKEAADDGIMEPSRAHADAKAHEEWARDHAEWEKNPDGKAEPMEWDYAQKAEKQYREDLQAYEEKIDGYMPERTPELTKEDVIVEREMQVKTPAQKLMNDISEHLAREYDPYTARDAVKDAVIQRRKDIEEVSADDSIYIEGIRRETNRLADELMAKMGVDGARLKTVKLLQTMSDGKVKPQVTGADIRKALPYLIEAPMRRRDIANEANEALEHLGYPARFTADNIKRAEKELDAIRDEAQELLALHKEMAEDGRTEMTATEQGLYGRVREGARKVADAMNGGGAAAEPQPTGKGPRIGADDVMATLSILTKRVKPEGLKVSEDMPELQPIIGRAKDWYAVAYGWLEDAGMRPDDIGYYKDYVNHVWDKERSDPEAYERYVANRQPTKSRNMRKREIRTLMDGEELGLVPKYVDIADLMGEYSKTNIQSWANKKMLVDLSGIDVVERDESGEPTSMMSLLTSRTPGAFDMDKYDYFEIAGVGPVWVHKAAAKNFGLVFETYEPGKLMGTYDKAASIAKNIELAWSGFHAAALTEVYVAQNVTRPKRATENFYKYLIHDSLLQGQPPAYADPELYKDAARHLVKLGATGDYAPEAMKQVSEQLKDFFGELRQELEAKGGLGKAAGMAVGIPEVVATAVKLVNEGMDKALWTWLHDGLKLCQYKMFREDVMAKAEKEGWSQDRINKALDEAGQYINDEFGGQHFEVIGVSPKTLRMMRRFLLSPDWLLSTQRHFLATFGFGSIYNKANVRNFRDFYKNIWQRGKGNTGQFDGRYSRAKASLACYVLGCMIMYPLVMNALNALLRKKDEEYEAQLEQENEGYVSKYKLAYPEGMKGFELDNLSLNPFNSFNIFGDYGMGSNAEGKKSHLFAGRYGDDTEMYIRWGKQFREFPELFETEQGDLGFPGPLLKRLMGKSNPNIRFLYDTLNYYTRWDKSKSDEDLEAKWKAWIGDGKLQRNIGIPVGVGANKLWQNYLPFWVPTQSDKEWKPTDMILPSTKGFTPYKARNYFMEFIKAGDEDGIKETFKASVLNGMTSAQISRAFDAALKAVENESRELQLKDGNDIHSVTEAFDASQDLKERKELNSRIRKMLAADAEPPQDWNEFMTTVRAERDGTTEGVTKASEKYLMVATSADVLEDARLAQLKKKASEMKRIHDGMKDNKADGKLLRQWEQQNQKWLDAGKMIKDGESGSESKQGILFWKKKLTGHEAKDRKALEMVRKKRKSLLKAVGERVK